MDKHPKGFFVRHFGLRGVSLFEAGKGALAVLAGIWVLTLRHKDMREVAEGLLVILHNDMDTPFPKEGKPPAYLEQMRALIKRHPKTTIIWAHTGMGRVVRPVQHHAATLEAMLKDPAFANLNFDISWTEVAKYITASQEATKIAADLINRYPDRFLFGTDEVAPADQEHYLKIYSLYDPLWKQLTPDASVKVRKGNYERLFNEARRRVRAWEKANLGTPGQPSTAPEQDVPITKPPDEGGRD